MNTPLTIGIIGGGLDSAVGGCHVAALRMDGTYRLGPCLFSDVEERNRQSHAFYGLPWIRHPKSLGNWLDEHKRSIDLLAILTPSTQHLEHLSEVAARGISFVTEKPIVCGTSEIPVLLEALSTADSIQARFIHNYSGYPMFRELVLRLEEMCIGRVHSVRIMMPSDAFAREGIVGKPQNWRQRDTEIPMIMLDLGTHLHHLVRMAIGKSRSRVIARMHQLVNSFNVIDNVEIWEEREDGIRVSYWMSKAHLGIKNGLQIEVYGDDGALIWHQMDPDHLTQIDINSNRTLVNRGTIRNAAARRDRFKAGHPTGFVEAFANFYSDLAEDFHAVRNLGERNRWIRPIEDAFDGIRFLDAATRSFQSSQWISL